jgi:hypothetical protein
MAYSAGSTILDDDYNIFATGNAAGTGNNSVANVNTIWGAGIGIRGWGQTGSLSPVTAGTTITATQWAALVNRATAISNHTSQSITPISVPNIGNTVEAYGALQSNIDALFASSARNDAAANGTDATSTDTTTSSWSASATLVKTFTFASAAQMRYFFNAGGMIRLGLSRTGGTSSPQNTAWSTLTTALGTLVLTGANTSKTIAGVSYTGFTKIGGSGSPSTYETGRGRQFFEETATDATYFTLIQQSAATYLYTANFAKLEAQINAASTVLTFRITLDDSASPPGGPDTVDGTLSATWTVRPPSTTYISNTWGTVTANSPSWVLV